VGDEGRAAAQRCDVDSVNLASLDFWQSPYVHDGLRFLRQHKPVSWHEHPDSGKGFWSVVRHADIAVLNNNAADFSNRDGVRINHDAEMKLVRMGTGAMLELDPPDHTRYRKLVSKSFTPRAVSRFEDMIRARSRAIIASIAGKGSCEFVSEAAAVLPLHVICDIVGVPDGTDRQLVFELVNRSLGENDPDLSTGPDYGSAAVTELKAYGQSLAEERAKQPQDDMLTTLLNVEIDGRGLDPVELGGFFSMLIAAGNETTRNAISHGLDGFTQFPDQRKVFLDRPELARAMSEEVVRWATPLMHMRRTVTRDLEFGGVQMKAGQKVAMWYISANRDESVFDMPFRFDVTRDPNRHQAFGGGGPHFCLGGNLGRLEIIVFFQELFTALPDIRAVAEPEPLRSNQFRGVRQLPVEFTPR
jgi:methyl-branched lipid omega-hydroxylase